MKLTQYIELTDSISELLNINTNRSNVVVFIDENVQRIYGSQLPKADIVIRSGESSKNCQYVNSLISILLEKHYGRDSVFLAIGGGVTSDIVGFIASVFKRGVSLELVPTTLLSQVDASIGGKNGVDIGQCKNVIGTFYLPQKILRNINFIKSLPQTEYINGLVELLKTFIISDIQSYRQSVSFFKRVNSVQMLESDDNLEQLNHFVRLAAEIKSKIVEIDPYDNGERLLLNLGHTFGHAIESYSNFAYSHAQSVAIGIVLSAKISNKLGLLPKEQMDEIINDFSILGLPISCDIDFSQLTDYLNNDKKNKNNTCNYILIDSIGSAFYKSIAIDQLISLAQ